MQILVAESLLPLLPKHGPMVHPTRREATQDILASLDFGQPRSFAAMASLTSFGFALPRDNFIT